MLSSLPNSTAEAVKNTIHLEQKKKNQYYNGGKKMAVEALTTAGGLLGIGAGLALGLGAIGTGLAQQQIIPAVMGAITEDPKMLGKGIFLILLPETLVIFGFAIAMLLMGRM